ncbi:putative tellurite resistance protein B-like protein [Haloferula luteola]|uniref:Putative tellurite resistance protein B-like protein n=1 Tax=Haloferula luteola TaxID=595692 RepID=A0A840V7G1_9BACT|nr:TerB N-terminal domain-containing protein [Haloferula luteola]MBB5350678.1 putative tellurite resistance protein B-like protein [Haloferula luteola]
MTEIESADVSRMVHSSSSELLQELNAKKALIWWWPGVIIACVIVLFMILMGFLPSILLFPGFLLSIAAVIWAYRRDVLRKTVVLLYDFDSAMEQAYGNLHRAASILAKCSARWHISAAGRVHDSRYHAGASSLVSRKDTTIRAKSPDFLKTNIETIAIDVGKQTLYFFPDRLLVYDGGRIGAVGYDDINVQVQQKRFIEDGNPPRDAYVVDHTWRYVNKNGSPDKRFSNNARLPICLYDEIHFKSPSGLNEVIQVSKYGVGVSLVEAIRSFGKLARPHAQNGGATVEKAISPASPAPSPSPPPISASPVPEPIRRSFTPEPPPSPATPAPRQVPVPSTAPPERSPGVPDVSSSVRPPKGSRLQWILPGTSAQIAGRTTQGMIYVCDTGLGWADEPSAIYKTADVDQRPSDREDLPYYPSYSTLSPSQRAFYLDWLARGRRDAVPEHLPTGYLFLFFYGIERRMLVDGDFDPAMWFEVYELLRIYGLTRRSRSVASYFGDFLHFTSYSQGPAGYANVCQGLLDLQGRRTSETALTLALANHYRANKPIDWAIAHLVAMNLDDSRRSVVTERTGDAFKGMFRKRFEDRYPEGMVLKTSKREQIVRYQTGNNSLNPCCSNFAAGGGGSDAAVLLKVPGVMGIKSQFKALSSIWNQCIEELSGYSRAVARLSSAASVSNQDRLKAHLALPVEIRKDHPHPLTDPFAETLQTCPEFDGIHFIPVGLLAGLLGIGERATLTQRQSEDLAALVESFGYTIAPHPVILNLPLAWNQEVALAACAETPTTSKELGGLLRLLYLAVLVASADGVVDETELEVFHRASGISDEYGRIQIRATEAALTRDTNVASKQLQRIAKSVHQGERMIVFKLLVQIACSDGVLSSDENRLLRRISKAFQIGDDALDNVLTEDSTFQTVTVSRGKTRTGGEAIPQSTESIAPSFSLDMNRIAALTAETAEVVSILSKALAEESHEDSVPVAVEAPELQHAMIPEWMESLESRYHPALLEIIAISDRQTIDIAAIAGRHYLMADDLVDGINAWSDEALGDFLIEITDDGQTNFQSELLPTH